MPSPCRPSLEPCPCMPPPCRPALPALSTYTVGVTHICAPTPSQRATHGRPLPDSPNLVRDLTLCSNQTNVCHYFVYSLQAVPFLPHLQVDVSKRFTLGIQHLVEIGHIDAGCKLIGVQGHSPGQGTSSIIKVKTHRSTFPYLVTAFNLVITCIAFPLVAFLSPLKWSCLLVTDVLFLCRCSHHKRECAP